MSETQLRLEWCIYIKIIADLLQYTLEYLLLKLNHNYSSRPSYNIKIPK
jgi:hypothetical protein